MVLDTFLTDRLWRLGTESGKYWATKRLMKSSFYENVSELGKYCLELWIEWGSYGAQSET